MTWKHTWSGNEQSVSITRPRGTDQPTSEGKEMMDTDKLSPHAKFQARLIWITWRHDEAKMLEILARLLTNIEELEQQEE